MEQQTQTTDSKKVESSATVTKDLADKIKTENDKKKSAVEAGKIILK